jgi:hypothetical protein
MGTMVNPYSLSEKFHGHPRAYLINDSTAVVVRDLKGPELWCFDQSTLDICRVHSGEVHEHSNLTVTRSRLRNLPDRENLVSRATRLISDCTHEISPLQRFVSQFDKSADSGQ